MGRKKIIPQEDPVSYEEEFKQGVQKDDPEARDSAIYANGDYICCCVECKTTFVGTKWDIFCLNCLNKYHRADD